MAKKKSEKDVLIVRDEKTGEISVVAGLNADFDGEGRDAVLCRKGRLPGAVPDAALCGPNGAERLPYGEI